MSIDDYVIYIYAIISVIALTTSIYKLRRTRILKAHRIEKEHGYCSGCGALLELDASACSCGASIRNYFPGEDSNYIQKYKNKKRNYETSVNDIEKAQKAAKKSLTLMVFIILSLPIIWYLLLFIWDYIYNAWLSLAENNILRIISTVLQDYELKVIEATMELSQLPIFLYEESKWLFAGLMIGILAAILIGIFFGTHQMYWRSDKKRTQALIKSFVISAILALSFFIFGVVFSLPIIILNSITICLAFYASGKIIAILVRY